jgi:hypothetical protein
MRYRYEYKVTDITKDNDNTTTETMGAMSLKKLQKKLDHKKLYKQSNILTLPRNAGYHITYL